MATISISKSELLNRLLAVSKIIPNKVSLPIMDNILMDIQDGRVGISAIGHHGRINTTIEEIITDSNFSICIEPRLLIEALKILPEQPLTISINETNFNILVKYTGGKFELMGKPADEFPVEKEIQDATKLSISSKVLLNGIEKTSFCAADDELRPIMNGIYFDISQGQINFVTSDGHKLALLECSDESLTETITFVLPQKIALILKNMLPQSDDLIDIIVGNKTVRFEYKSESIVALLLEGRYPNYRSVIPQNNDKYLTASVADFKGAIKRVSVFANKSSSLIRLELSNNQIKLSAQDIDYSVAAEETVSCEYDNTSFAIGFKGNFLTELISAIPISDLQMSFYEPTRASLITPVKSEEADALTYLLMPMMLAE